MKISDYMKKNEMTYRSFGELVKVNHATIFNFVTGKTKELSMVTIKKIIKGTQNKVTLEDLLDEECR